MTKLRYQGTLGSKVTDCIVLATARQAQSYEQPLVLPQLSHT